MPKPTAVPPDPHLTIWRRIYRGEIRCPACGTRLGIAGSDDREVRIVPAKPDGSPGLPTASINDAYLCRTCRQPVEVRRLPRAA